MKESYNKDDLVLFLGAGISRKAKIPNWEKLISDLFVYLISERLTYENIDLTKKDKELIINKFMNKNNDSPLLQARYIRNGLGDEFITKLSDILYKNCKDTSKLLNAIAKLCQPIRDGLGIKSVITYNFDDLLEYSLDQISVKYKSIYRTFDIPSKNELEIYHVHGFLPRNPNEYENINESNLIFSEEEYHKLILNSYNWSNLVQLNNFKNNTCLFIGLSVTDPNLRRLLDIAMDKYIEEDTPKHYVILKRNEIFKDDDTNQEINEENIKNYEKVNRELTEEYYKELGLNILWVDNYNEIPDIIDKIGEDENN